METKPQSLDSNTLAINIAYKQLENAQKEYAAAKIKLIEAQNRCAQVYISSDPYRVCKDSFEINYRF